MQIVMKDNNYKKFHENDAGMTRQMKCENVSGKSSNLFALP